MTSPDFDRDLTAWLDARAPARAPEHLLGATVHRTARTRPRPAWLLPERWLPMTIALRPAAFPRGLVLILLAGAVLLALLTAAVGVGWRPFFDLAVAPPTGPAANGLIAFERDRGIYVAEPDGSEVRPLVTGPAIHQGASWSRNGTRLAYWSSQSADGPWDLVVSDADGSDQVVAATGIMEPLTGHGVEWSLDGSTLLFASRTVRSGVAPCMQTATLGEFCSGRIFTAAADGSTGAVMIGDPELDARSPSWSPDGSIVAFGGGDARDAIRLHLMSADGSDVRPIGDESGAGWSFVLQSWSPDGSRIATQVGETYWDIITIEVDDGTTTRITDTPFSDEVGPAYAPDGALAWYAARSDPCCVNVLGPDGDLTRLEGGVPIWSPDGRSIATDIEGDALLLIGRDGVVIATIEDAAAPSWQRR